MSHKIVLKVLSKITGW